MFASKTPRDLNHDPQPWEIPNGYRYAEFNEGEAMFGGIRHNPRPEFDHVQHNAPNPILVEFRKGDWYYANVSDEAAWWIHGLVNYATEGSATPAQIDHARKVLSRLAALQEVS